MNTVTLLFAFLVPAMPPPSGIKPWHFSLTCSHQLQYSRKETLISSCFPLGHPSYCFHSFCSNLLVTKRYLGLWSSLHLRLCLSLAELLLSSLLRDVFCWSAGPSLLSQLGVLCLGCCAVLSAGRGRWSWYLLLSVWNDAAHDLLLCHFLLSLLHLPLDIIHELYISVFFNSHMSFFLSPNTISLMQKCQHQPHLVTFSKKHLLFPSLLSPCLVEAFWEHPLLSISCLQIQVLAK